MLSTAVISTVLLSACSLALDDEAAGPGLVPEGQVTNFNTGARLSGERQPPS